jgi:diguanylate cyclase (GGDEF)-like protein
MWRPQLGSFSPGQFIAIVEECALFVPIGRQVLRSEKQAQIVATILVVDDSPFDRAFLVELLSHQQHRVLEANHGADALAWFRKQRPDLVITDIMLPAMDGFEFVRRVRSDPATATIPIIIFTAEYNRPEATALAQSCGISSVLTKPCKAAHILRMVEESLRPLLTVTDGSPPQEASDEAAHVIDDKAAHTAEYLRVSTQRLAALVDINLQLVSEQDQQLLLKSVCRAARRLLGAKYSALAVGSGASADDVYFFTSGVSTAVVKRLGPRGLREGIVGKVFTEREPRRLKMSPGNSQVSGLPRNYPPVHSLLAAPIVSLSKVYGWICLTDKIGQDEFSAADEELLRILADQVGRFYEIRSLYIEIQQHATRLEAEVAQRALAERRLKRLNRVYAVLSQINALVVRVQNREQLFWETCRIAVEAGAFRMAWIGVIDSGTLEGKVVAWYGGEKSYVDNIRLTARDGAAESERPACRALRLSRPIICNDIEADPSLAALRDELLNRGHKAVGCFPVTVAGRPEGVLALFAGETNAFDDEEAQLLLELARSISFSVDHMEKHERLNYLAYYDELTGLANRALFLERVAQYQRSAISGGHKLALFLIDLERFKNINDSLGRPAGDALLKLVADWLTHSLDDANLVARVGADQFAVVLPQVIQDGDVTRLLETIVKALPKQSFQLSGAEFRISAKVGIALFPDDGANADALFKNAEAALRNAKTRGDRFLFYAQQMTETVAGKLTLENQLRQALDKGEFVLHYQPKVSLASGKLTGAEALIRWNDPRSGLVPPAGFISVLEETGLIYEVGRWALHQAIDDYLRWRKAGLDVVRIAVNVSPLQLRRRDFVAEILEAIGIDPAAAAGLELEITETLIMEDVKYSIESLQAIRDTGVEIAIDDFGTGFSSLSSLHKLPLDTLKIDRSFVADMNAGPEGMALVSTIIKLARSLKLKVVAEGVETQEQSRLLRLLDCDEMQGYLFSRPVAGEIFATTYLASAPIA